MARISREIRCKITGWVRTTIVIRWIQKGPEGVKNLQQFHGEIRSGIQTYRVDAYGCVTEQEKEGFPIGNVQGMPMTKWAFITLRFQ